VYPANSPLIRPAVPADAHALRRLAVATGRSPLTGRVLVAEVRGALVAAISREEDRVILDRTRVPAHVAAMLRVRAQGLDAVEREPDLAERLREAVLGPRDMTALPLAA
jgi:hypothetical protein